VYQQPAAQTQATHPTKAPAKPMKEAKKPAESQDDLPPGPTPVAVPDAPVAPQQPPAADKAPGGHAALRAVSIQILTSAAQPAKGEGPDSVQP
jgi:hypothetical protein